ncbi:MAG: hypothetical protein JXR83_03455 [Deltaproteobacteria bacterium]|nr:hypothetical protein [Deltaproteobacteria bacterium]
MSLTGQLLSAVYAVIDPRASASGHSDLSCDDLIGGQLSPGDLAVNVVASGYVNFNETQGTALFPNCNFGLIPIGRYLVYATGHPQQRGEGAALARGCLEGLVVESATVKTNLQMNSIN